MPILPARKRFLLSLLVAAACILSFAETVASAQYQIKSWTTDDGLPQNTIHSITQTTDGYLWLATLDGLVRFDGARFTIFNKNNSPGINSNRFTELVADERGNLWIGTENGEITRCHNGIFQTYTLTDNVDDKAIWNLRLDDKGELVAFTGAGIFRWNGDERFVTYSPVAGETKNSAILWGKSGAMWIAEGQTLRRFKHGKTSEYQLPGTARIGNIKSLLEDGRGRLWIGTKSGLFVLENEKLSVYTIADGLPDNEITPRAEDRDGNLWAVTGKGAVIISADGKVKVLTTEQGLSDNTLSMIYEDREGNIWVGTFFRGLNRISRRSVMFYSTGNGLRENIVRLIYEDRERRIWIGGGGLTRFESGIFSQVERRDNFPVDVTAIEQDRAGRLWFGHWSGAYYVENGKFTNFTSRFGMSPTLTDIHEDRAGTMWFGTIKGLFRYLNGEMTRLTTMDGLPSDDVKVIHESPDGTLWIGTYGGLSRYRDGAFVSFTAADGLASNLVRSIYEEVDGTLWIGTYDGGLTRFKNDKFTRYTSKDGLYNDGVFQILEDASGNFWMSSNRGIYRVPKQQLNDFADGKISRIESIALGKEDGLLETECNGGQQPAGIKTGDGKLWFPTQRGAAVIDLEKIRANPYPPPVIVESAMIDGEIVALNDEIEIAPGKNNLEIAYTGLSFVKPEFVKFRYRLEGQDADWVEAGNRRTAYYSYLSPGEYTFQVIAANSDDVWNTEGKTLRIKVVPPFYRTWWFNVLSALSFFGILFAGYRVRLRQIEKKHRQQEIFSRRLIDSQERERKRFAAEMHDGLGQSLVIIKNRAGLSLKQPENQTAMLDHLKNISATASHAIEETREIAFNLRPHLLDRLGLTQTIESMLDKVFTADRIEYEARIDLIDDLLDKDSEILFFRVVQEFASNIVKHSGAKKASVIIEHNGQRLKLKISDDGKGFDSSADDASRRGFGLIGTGERIRLLNGTLHIESAVGKGTTISVEIDLKK